MFALTWYNKVPIACTVANVNAGLEDFLYTLLRSREVEEIQSNLNYITPSIPHQWDI